MPRSRLRMTGLALLMVLIFSVPAWTANRTINRASPAGESRVALVIGNGDYKSIPLQNPVSDAKAMARALENLGFQVTLRTDQDQRGMERAISRFGRAIPKGGVALFYYAGHGLQVSGRNYLIPVGKEITDQADVKYDAVDAGRIVDRLEGAKPRLSMVILDACRNNPFRGFRSSDQGLAAMTAGEGTIIAYATAPGSVAADGRGRHSPYNKALIRAMKKPGISVERVFKEAARQVKRERPEQVPWVNTSFTGDFYFVASASGAAPAPPSASSGNDGYGPPESTDEQKVADLLAKAEAHMTAGRLTTPQGASAVDFYRMVLREEPANARALDGLHRIVGKYVTLARGRIKARDWDRAETYLNRASTVSEADDRILSVRDELRSARLAMTTTTTTAYVARPTTTTTFSRPAAEGKYFTNSIGMKFVKIPGRDYYMGATEVTQSQWQAVMGGNPSNFKGGNRPVERVSWNDAQEFIRKLNAKEETNKYRLPTEAEWEHAARAGSSGDWCFGNDESLLEEYAWYDKNSGSQTHPVGQKQPNAWGLYDMHGNVWEWCQDLIAGRCRVLRGGSWCGGARHSRSAVRSGSDPDGPSNDVGFRLTRTK